MNFCLQKIKIILVYLPLDDLEINNSLNEIIEKSKELNFFKFFIIDLQTNLQKFYCLF